MRIPSPFLFYDGDRPACLDRYKYSTHYILRCDDTLQERGRLKVVKLCFDVHGTSITLHAKILGKKAISNISDAYSRKQTMTTISSLNTRQRYHQLSLAVVHPQVACTLSKGPILLQDPKAGRKRKNPNCQRRHPPCVLRSNFSYILTVCSTLRDPMIHPSTIQCKLSTSSIKCTLVSETSQTLLPIRTSTFSISIQDMEDNDQTETDSEKEDVNDEKCQTPSCISSPLALVEEDVSSPVSSNSSSSSAYECEVRSPIIYDVCMSPVSPISPILSARSICVDNIPRCIFTFDIEGRHL